MLMDCVFINRIKVLLIGLQMLIVPHFLQAQQFVTERDSLIVELENARSVQQKAECYRQLVTLEQGDVYQQMCYIDEAIELFAQSSADEELWCEFMSMAVDLYAQVGVYEQVQNCIERNDEKLNSIKNRKLVAQLYIRCSQHFVNLKDNINAIEVAYKAIREYMNMGNIIDQIDATMLLGNIYLSIGEPSEALYAYLRCEELANQISGYFDKINVYYAIGVAYRSLHYYSKSLEYFFKTMNLSYKDSNIEIRKNIFSQIGELYEEQLRFDDAQTYLKRAYKLSTRVADTANNIRLLGIIGRIYIRQQEPDSAIKYLNRCIDFCQVKRNIIEQTNAYFNLGKVYMNIGNTQQAINCFKKSYASISKTDSVYMQTAVLLELAMAYGTMGDNSHQLGAVKLINDIRDSVFTPINVSTESDINRQIQSRARNSEFNQNINFYHNEMNLQHYWMQNIKTIVISFLVLIVLIASVHTILLSRKRKKAKQSTISGRDIVFRGLSAIFNSIPNVEFVIDSKGIICACNNAFVKACGLPANQIENYTLHDLNQKTNNQWDFTEILADEFNIDKPYVYQPGEIQYADGSVHEVMCYVMSLGAEANAIANDQFRMITIIDVTEISKSQKELIKTRDQLKEALDAKNRFFCIFAHDLKNPFNGVIGMSELLLEYYDSYSKEDIYGYLKIINESATQIFSLLSNLLDWSRVQSGIQTCVKSNFPLSDVAITALQLFNCNMSDKHIKVNQQIDDECIVRADRAMLMTIFRNIIGNAIKFTHDGGTISVVATNVDDNHVKVSISDTGVGMQQDMIDKLFDANHPITTLGVNKEKGTGLGLIVCQQFAHMNDTEIKVESTVNIGTTFSFMLEKVAV